MVLDLYINSVKCIQRLVYYKEPINKDNKVTVENIVNLRQMRHKKRKKNNKIDNNVLFKERIEKMGIIYDNLLKFESHFESGNLQLVYITEALYDKNSLNDNDNENKNINLEENINKSNNIDNENKGININENEKNNIVNYIKNGEIEKYELFLHNDTNTSGYTQWFFFRVSNTKKGKKVNLNIMNLLRKRTKYSNGIKIWCYSKKKSENDRIGWHHTTEDVNYYKNFLYKLNKGKKEFYYTLSFNYTFEFDKDEVFFANCIPFTYTDLTRDLNVYTKNENDKYVFFNRKKLCSTIIGNDVEYFSINTSTIYPNIKKDNSNSVDKIKNGIVLFARQHPSETVGSWTLRGAIDFLMGESDEANYLRDNFIFKIIPMINVDGVICGNTRTSLSGCDLNRRWANPNILLHPEIFYTKDIIMDFCGKYKIECIVDFHGHFGAFNSFFYANHRKDNYSSCRFFPFSCSKKSKVIQFEKSQFKMPKYKKGTGRINLFKELDVENVVTLETSYFGCNSGGYVNQYFNVETLQEIGRDICNGILLFHYHSNLQLGIDNNLNSYPLLQNKVENDEKIINNQFAEYINNLKNEKINDINSEEDNNENKSTKSKNENEKDNTENDDDDYLNDSVSDSESDPSGDNLEECEILKLLPPPKKLKKISRKGNIRKKFNKRNPIGLNHNISNNLNNIKNNIRYYSNGIPLQKNNNNGINNLCYSLPKVKDYLNKNKLNNITNYESIKSNKKIYRNINASEDEKHNRNDNNSLNKTEKEISAKNIFLGKNPTSPNIMNNNNTNLNLCLINKNPYMIDRFTQTEEIFFKYSWKKFIGIYKILTPKIELFPFLYQLRPIKNSYSYINKKNCFISNAIIPPPQNVERIAKHSPEHKMLYMMRMGKYNLGHINNDKLNKGNSRNSSMVPFGPLYNNNFEKSRNNDNTVYENYSNLDRIRGFNIKNQKFMHFPIVSTKNIFFKKVNEKQDFY